jgi:hypothetical protein
MLNNIILLIICIFLIVSCNPYDSDKSRGPSSSTKPIIAPSIIGTTWRAASDIDDPRLDLSVAIPKHYGVIYITFNRDKSLKIRLVEIRETVEKKPDVSFESRVRELKAAQEFITPKAPEKRKTKNESLEAGSTSGRWELIGSKLVIEVNQPNIDETALFRHFNRSINLDNPNKLSSGEYKDELAAIWIKYIGLQKIYEGAFGADGQSDCLRIKKLSPLCFSRIEAQSK